MLHLLVNFLHRNLVGFGDEQIELQGARADVVVIDVADLFGLRIGFGRSQCDERIRFKFFAQCRTWIVRRVGHKRLLCLDHAKQTCE